MKNCYLPIASIALMMGSTSLAAQEWNPQQSEVWTFVSGAWKTHVDASTWAEDLDPGGYGWNTDYPVPTSREQMRARTRVFGAEGKVLHYQLDPIKISVNGDTAIAYYYANVVEKNYEDKRKSSVERCADTLIKRSGKWQFLGWLCETKSSGSDD